MKPFPFLFALVFQTEFLNPINEIVSFLFQSLQENAADLDYGGLVSHKNKCQSARWYKVVGFCKFSSLKTIRGLFFFNACIYGIWNIEY